MHEIHVYEDTPRYRPGVNGHAEHRKKETLGHIIAFFCVFFFKDLETQYSLYNANSFIYIPKYNHALFSLLKPNIHFQIKVELFAFVEYKYLC